MSLFEAVFLGLIQGLTEFLPVSSTGHLVLVRDLLGITVVNGLAFDAVLHLATVAAVVIYFYSDLYRLLQTMIRKLGRLPVNDSDVTLVYALLIATIPAGVLGFLLEEYIGTVFRSSLLVAGVLIAGSILFMYAEWMCLNNPRINSMDTKKGLKIGLFQCLALLPGMSRSGACLAGGMILGFSRAEATRFAFLLAIPILSGAGLKKLIELIQSTDPIAWSMVAVGAGTAFVTGLLAIHFMLAFIRKHTLWPFIWYRIILAGFVIFVTVFG